VVVVVAVQVVQLVVQVVSAAQLVVASAAAVQRAATTRFHCCLCAIAPNRPWPLSDSGAPVN